MKSYLKRIARLDTVRGVKQQRVDEEARALAVIRSEKGRVEMQLAEWQQKYVEGVTSLNAERESASRSMLFALESAVDHARETLFSLFQALREMDARERAQMMQLDLVQRELEAVKTLQDTRRQDLNRELARHEQKQLDEIGLRRFIQSR
jgi:flagellar export protein FliJ